MKVRTELKTYDGYYDIVMIRTDSTLTFCNGILYQESEIILDLKDEENIRDMAPECTVYAEFPDRVPNRIIEDMMEWFKNQ